MTRYLAHQIRASDEALVILDKLGMCYIYGQPRSGKTRTALRIADEFDRVLVFCPKAAIAGWASEMGATGICVDITNYEQAKHTVCDSHDLVIIDEAHNLGNRGKPSQRWKAIKKVVGDASVLYLSGTPIIETPLGIYYQFALSNRTPLKYKSFYRFFDEYGIPAPMQFHGRLVETYKKARPELLDVIEPYIVRVSQDDAGIEHQAQDVVHVVELTADTKKRLSDLARDEVLYLGDEVIPIESDMQERVTLHQIESGAIKKPDGDIVLLENTEVMDYLMDTFGDSPDNAFMVHFHSTRAKLKEYFKETHIYSSNAHAEGVSLADYKHFVVVNSGYSGAKFVQRRERGTNINRTTEALVHHITTDAGVSAAVYDAVSNKLNFNLATFRRMRYE